jgi:hypothetical protein
MSTDALLRATLQLAVPLHVMELQRLPFSQILALAPELSQVVAEKGDVIQFREKGKSAAAFNALAKAIAVLSFFPGGVRFLGDHYQNTHPENSEARSSEPTPLAHLRDEGDG